METIEKLSAKDIELLQTSRKMLLVNSVFNPELALFHKNNTYWEELTCIGFNPAISRLEAVVSIKRATGYSGDLCSNGSTEFVRFFIDWNNNGIYQNLGLASFKAHDISNNPPGPQHPLKYMVYMKLNDKQYRKLCKVPVLPKIRAVLSWNVPSSPVNPFAPVTFGNAVEARIQLRPRFLFDHFVNADKLLLKENISTAFFNNKQAVAETEPDPVPWSQLQEQYKKLDVADHRFLYNAIHPLVSETKNFTTLAAQKDIGLLKQLNIDIAKVADILFAQKYDVTYEELTCVGLNTSTDLLGAVIKIKRPGGFSGGLCEAGSYEHVAFWADWNNNGTFDQYLGTASVKVHDIPGVKKDNELYYAVSLPFDLHKHLKTCNIPNIVRIRAVLSWSSAPSTTNPNAPVHWGNSLDVLVQIRPGKVGVDLLPLIEAVSGVTLDTIDVNPVSQAYGLGNSNTVLGPDSFNTFGGVVYITGEFLNSGPSRNVKYKLQFDDGSGWQAMMASQTYRKEFPTFPTSYAYETQTPPDGWFEYIPDGATVGVVNKTLASWSTGTRHGIHKLRMLYTIDKVNIFTYEFTTIRVNNTDFYKSPTANNVVDPFSSFDLVIDGGDCHSYDKASPIINGHLRVLHEAFGFWTLGLEPATHTHGIIPGPATYRPVTSLSDTGDGNYAWTLDTTGLDKCGYTITLRGYDRTIVNGSLSGRHADAKSVGFAVL